MGDPTIDTELDALRAGDEGAFQSLIHRHHGPMLRLAMTYIGDRGVAEDVVQEAWLTCLRSLDRFESRSSLKTWLYSATRSSLTGRKQGPVPDFRPLS